MKDNLEYLEKRFKSLQTPAALSELKENRDDEKIEMWQGLDVKRILLRIKNDENEVKKLMDLLHSKMPW